MNKLRILNKVITTTLVIPPAFSAGAYMINGNIIGAIIRIITSILWSLILHWKHEKEIREYSKKQESERKYV